LGQWLRPASRAWSANQLDVLQRLVHALDALNIALLKGEILFLESEPPDNFEEFGQDIQINFEPYQSQEQAKVKLLQRFKAFLFQPVQLDFDDPDFSVAFCGAVR
jgi:hypothetical protein